MAKHANIHGCSPETRWVTTRDIVIPAGTEVSPGPKSSRYFTDHGEILVEVNKDCCGALRIDLESALHDGLFKEVA